MYRLHPERKDPARTGKESWRDAAPRGCRSAAHAARASGGPAADPRLAARSSRTLFALPAPALSYWGRAAQWAGGSQSEPDPGDHLHRDRGGGLRPGRSGGGPARTAVGAAGHLAAPGLPRHPARPRSAPGRVQHRDLPGLPGAGHRRRRPGGDRVELRRHPPPALARHPHPGRGALRRERHRDLPQRPGQRPDGQPPRRRPRRPGGDRRPRGRLARGLGRAHPRPLRPAPAHAAGARPPDRRRAPPARGHRPH